MDAGLVKTRLAGAPAFVPEVVMHAVMPAAVSQWRGGCPDDSSSSGQDAEISSPGIARCSLTQAPRSINLQRSLQNGLNGDSGDHSTGRLQVGQGTLRGMPQVQVDNVNRTSSVVWTGRLPASCQTRKRMLQR